MKAEITQLFDELREICAQYAAEVPGKRRPWPESIKTRVFRLRFLGLSNHRIAQETVSYPGIPNLKAVVDRSDPNAGRFLQKDPAPGKLSIPVSVVNSYAYAGNNPFTFRDPSYAGRRQGSFLSMAPT